MVVFGAVGHVTAVSGLLPVFESVAEDKIPVPFYKVHVQKGAGRKDSNAQRKRSGEPPSKPLLTS